MQKILATAALATVLLTGGCLFPSVSGNYEGGSRASDDKHVYVSRPHSPKTVSLVNTVTGETLWTVEIPVGDQLVLRFYDKKHDDPIMSSNMRWEVMEETTSARRLNNVMTVPGRNYRRLDLEIREAPEFPETAAAG